jgi:hypothetical protein
LLVGWPGLVARLDVGGFGERWRGRLAGGPWGFAALLNARMGGGFAGGLGYRAMRNLQALEVRGVLGGQASVAGECGGSLGYECVHGFSVVGCCA